jgi:peroxidase
MVRITTIILVLGVIFQLAFAQPEWRTLDGRNNNRNHPLWGSTNIQLTRDNIQWYYEDGFHTPLTTGYPSPREVSNRLFSMVPENPLAAQGFSDMHTFWGQFLDHDITWSPELENDLLYIPIPEQNDVFFNPFNQQNLTMKFKRSTFDTSTGTGPGNPRAQVNVLSAFIDGSMVYGVESVRANALRDFNTKGKLKTTTINGHVYPPKNTFGLPNANSNRFVPNEEQFLCGDKRCNENPMLTALHTVFVREHNRLADKFAQDHPDWDGERIYQEARRWIGAFCQAITFNEYSLATTGRALPEYTGYQPDVNPSIMGAFSSVAFRYGHSEVNQLIPRLDENRRPIAQGHLLFRDGYFNPPAWESEGIEAMIRGSAWQHQQEVDLFYVNDIRNFLFGLPGQGGLDLAALTIERGRDHGMPPYNQLRAAYNLPPKTFDQISSKPEINQIFREVYKNNISLVDSFVAGLAEDKPTGAHVGELFREIIWEQYRRLRDGDRFYYRAPDAGFTADEISEIDSTRLSHIILRNTNIKALQCGVLFVSNALDCGEVTTAPTAGGAASVDLLGGNYNLAWQVLGDKITITMRANTNGWVGFGIPQAASRMVGADVVLGKLPNLLVS